MLSTGSAGAHVQPPVQIADVGMSDLPERDHLHDLVFGPGAYTRTAYRVREGSPRVSPWCTGARLEGQLIAFLRMTEIRVGASAVRAAVLGPVGVHPAFENRGFARGLIAASSARARADGVELVVLVGDPPYYGKLGFVPVPPGQITMPGPVDALRLLALELVPGALSRTRGLIAGV